MKKNTGILLSESKYIAFWVLIFSLLTEAVFLIVGKWNYTVLLGNFFGGAISVLNFFLMGLTLQNAVETDEKSAVNKMKLSQSLRIFMIFAAASVGCIAPCFNTVSVLLPFFFPRIAIAIRPMMQKNQTAVGR